jgi:hypothetical protein
MLTSGFNMASFLIKEAIPKKLVDAIRQRAVNTMKYLGENPMARDTLVKQKDLNRTLAAITRARAGEGYGMRLARGGKGVVSSGVEMKPGQKITDEGFEQMFIHPGDAARGHLPSAAGWKIETPPPGAGEIPYHLDMLQGFGKTRGRPLGLFRDMRKELADLHERANVGYRLTAIPGTKMPDPEMFNVKLLNNNRDVDIERVLGGVFRFPPLNAVPMWAKQHGESGFPQYLPGPVFGLTGSLKPITPELRQQMLAGKMDNFLYGAEWKPGTPRLNVPRSKLDPAMAAEIKSRAPEVIAPAQALGPVPTPTAAPTPGAVSAQPSRFDELLAFLRENRELAAAVAAGVPLTGLGAYGFYNLLKGDKGEEKKKEAA